MQAKRHKQIRNVLETYRRTFNFPEDQKVLIDPNALKISKDIGFDLLSKLERILGMKVEFWTTKCLIKELESIGEPVQQILNIARTFRCSSCSHLKGKQLGIKYFSVFLFLH